MKLAITLAIAIMPFALSTASVDALGGTDPSEECVAEFERVNASGIEAGPYKVLTMRVRGDSSTVTQTLVVDPPRAAMLAIPASNFGPLFTLTVNDRGWTRKADSEPWTPVQLHEGYFEFPRQRLLGRMPLWVGQTKPYFNLRCEPDAELDGKIFRVFGYDTAATSHDTGHFTVYADRKTLRPKWQASFMEGDGGRGGHGKSDTVWQEFTYDSAIMIRAPE